MPAPSNPGGRHLGLALVTVTHIYPAHGGGLERVAGRLVEEFVRAGARVCWFSSDTDAPPPDVPGRAIHISVSTANFVYRLTQLPYPFWSPVALPRLWRAIGAANIVHVHEHLYHCSIVAIVIARLRGRPVVVTQHMGALAFRNAVLTALYKAGVRLFGRSIFPLTSRRVFISANVRSFFGRDLDPKSRLIFNGVDTGLFTLATPTQRQREREMLQIPATAQVVLFVGRLVRKKGLHIIEQLAQRFTGVLWMIVGAGPEDPSRWNQDNVRVYGRVSHDKLASYYRAADLLLLPSSGEGFPLVVQEALCCGTGVLSTEEVASACPEAAPMIRTCPTPRHGDSIDCWAKALDEALSDGDDVDGRQARSQAARAMWSWEDCARRYMELFAEVSDFQR
jgi:glycosyltransferase involved in cell wall biosynthesis